MSKYYYISGRFEFYYVKDLYNDLAFPFNVDNKENKLNIDIEKGSAYYEVIESYYIPYEKVEKSVINRTKSIKI